MLAAVAGSLGFSVATVLLSGCCSLGCSAQNFCPYSDHLTAEKTGSGKCDDGAGSGQHGNRPGILVWSWNIHRSSPQILSVLLILLQCLCLTALASVVQQLYEVERPVRILLLDSSCCLLSMCEVTTDTVEVTSRNEPRI